MPKALLPIIPLLLTCTPVFTQVKILQAVKTSLVPRIDGSLDDAAWKEVPEATDFITSTPVYGKTAVAKTTVKVIYDNTSIYIGAYLYDDPSKVRRQFTARDKLQGADVDFFAVFLDTYKDRQNGYEFLVTARNVQTDARVSPNYKSDETGAYGDLSWDAVWDSRVGFEADGWVVEMRIPFYSIRFSKNFTQEWGLQFLRYNRRFNETAFWNPVNPNVNGFVNQFGNMNGLNNLVPPLRLSFSPYISGGYRETPELPEGKVYETLKSGGMDVKYGISESFTLDATLIPDFGQVISDNVVNNLSPFEIQFRENRPFFTEGTELFNKAGIFYSRRIGSTPEGYSSLRQDVQPGGDLDAYTLIKNPSVTRLYNAIKFSGRTAGNFGIGIFNAVTQPAKATLRNKTTLEDSTVVTEPLTNYNIIVLDQALKNRSYITLTNTNVLRNGHERDANTTAVDIALYDKQNRYGVILRPRYSKIYGDNGGYDGYANSFEFAKVSGKLQFSLMNELKSAQYDPNDLGINLSPNDFTTTGSVSLNIFKPTNTFLNQRYEIAARQSYLYQPFSYQQTEFSAISYWLFKNFWDLELSTFMAPYWFNDYFELQTPADLLATPRQPLKRSPYYSAFIQGQTDSRKQLYANWIIGGAEGPLPDDPYYRLSLGLRYRFSDRFSLEGSYFRQHDNGQFGYAFFRDNSTQAPILARRKYTDVTSVLSGIYNFTPRMNITFRARHFWNRLQNTNLYDVKPDGYWTERTDLTPSDYNINYNAFNLDVFFTWDFRLGSRLILGWKNWLGRDYEYFINGTFYKTYTRNVERVFDTPHGNEFTIRFIYFLNYQQFVGK